MSTDVTTAPRSLYAISIELMEIEHALEDVDADPATVAAAIEAYLEDSEELRIKADRYVMLIRELESRSKARREEASRLSDLSASDAKSASTLKTRLHEFMRAHEIPKLETLHFKLARQANGGVQAVIVDCVPEDLPADYLTWITTPHVNNSALRDALLAGQTIEHVTLADRGESLRIR